MRNYLQPDHKIEKWIFYSGYRSLRLRLLLFISSSGLVQDEMVDFTQSQALKAVVPETRLSIFEGGDHTKLFRDEPEAYPAKLG
ncbi:MAG: hypothetical protein GX142_01220 [Chloroflexi bacterium]|nr:hypothetical protein [Chloroflexota bacterium]